MPFANPIVGGNKLIRPAIQSPNYVMNTSGWTINRDGSAEFNNVTVRGGFQIGADPSPPNAYIRGEVLAGIPTISVYDGVHLDPATIQGMNLGVSGGIEIHSGLTGTQGTAVSVAGDFGELVYGNSVAPFESAVIHVGPPNSALIKLRTTSNTAQDLEIGFDLTSTTPDLVAGRLYTVGEIKLGTGTADANYPTRTVDGKAPPATTTTVIGTTDTNIGGANVQNTWFQAGMAYHVTIHIDSANANVGGRLEWKLWAGSVGTGTQLGGINRRWTDNDTTSTNYAGTTLHFMFRATTTGNVANLNLSATKAVVTAGVAQVQVNQAFLAIVEQIGDANMIGGL